MIHTVRILVAFALFSFAVASADGQRRQQAREFNYRAQIEELENKLPQGLSESDRRQTLAMLMRLYAWQAEIFEVLTASTGAAVMIYFDSINDSAAEALPADYVFSGIAAFETGDFGKALELFNTALTRPDIPPSLLNTARAWLGAVYYATGLRDRASETWRAAPANSRGGCTDADFLLARFNILGGDAVDRCGAYGSHEDNPTILRNVFAVYLMQGNLEAASGILQRLAAANPVYTEQEGQSGERRFYDISKLPVIANYYYALSASTASKLEAISTPEQRQEFGTAYYRGLSLYKSGRFDDVVRTLTGTEDLLAAALLAAAFYRKGEKDSAAEIFTYIERAGTDPILSETGRIAAELSGLGLQTSAIAQMRSALQNTLERSRRGVDQRLFRNLAEAYLLLGDYEEAMEMLSMGFRNERRGDPAGNDPAFSLLYGTAIIRGGYYTALPDAIDMFNTVLRLYPETIQLVEAVSLIDAATNIGREGRLIYRR